MSQTVKYDPRALLKFVNNPASFRIAVPKIDQIARMEPLTPGLGSEEDHEGLKYVKEVTSDYIERGPIEASNAVRNYWEKSVKTDWEQFRLLGEIPRFNTAWYLCCLNYALRPLQYVQGDRSELAYNLVGEIYRENLKFGLLLLPDITGEEAGIAYGRKNMADEVRNLDIERIYFPYIIGSGGPSAEAAQDVSAFLESRGRC